jgi:hypothetical protein
VAAQAQIPNTVTPKRRRARRPVTLAACYSCLACAATAPEKLLVHLVLDPTLRASHIAERPLVYSASPRPAAGGVGNYARSVLENGRANGSRPPLERGQVRFR